ncbi:hypothetical protein HETIRDRAFT_460683, partial [Heterobasidion irregulare TC 32-1]
MNTTSDFVEVIAQKIAYYTVVVERCQSDLRFRVLDDRTLQKHYKRACKQWLRYPAVYPVYMPAVGDATSKTAFFRKCDAVCASRPDTPLDYFLVIFAASGAIEVLISHEYNALDSSTSLAIFNAAHARAYPKAPMPLPSPPNDLARAPTATPPKPATTPATATPRVSRADSDAVRWADALLDTSIRYIDAGTNVAQTCTVVDHGASIRRGEYFGVRYEDGRAEEISGRKMREIWNNRIGGTGKSTSTSTSTSKSKSPSKSPRTRTSPPVLAPKPEPDAGGVQPVRLPWVVA